MDLLWAEKAQHAVPLRGLGWENSATRHHQRGLFSTIQMEKDPYEADLGCFIGALVC